MCVFCADEKELGPADWEALCEFVSNNGFLSAVVITNSGLTDKVCAQSVIRAVFILHVVSWFP